MELPFEVASATDALLAALRETEPFQTCARLRENATFEVWERRADGKLVVRFVTSWATRPEAIEELLALL